MQKDKPQVNLNVIVQCHSSLDVLYHLTDKHDYSALCCHRSGFA